MMKVVRPLIVIVGVLLCSTSYAEAWVNTTGSNIPANAVQAGKEADGKALYICRANYQGGVHPGKTRAEFNGCNIGYGGKEVAVSSYQVMVSSRWVAAKDGSVPANAVAGGNEANGQTIYLCRANYQNGIHLGKLRAEFKGCNLSYGGKEVMVSSYEVMVSQ